MNYLTISHITAILCWIDPDRVFTTLPVYILLFKNQNVRSHYGRARLNAHATDEMYLSEVYSFARTL